MGHTIVYVLTLLCILAPFAYNIYRISQEKKLNKAFGDSHGCLPPPRLQNQRPFGVDRLEQIFRANAESRLMELFLFHFRQTGSTLEQVFLGTPALGTIEPANLEAVLSTNFKDWGIGPRKGITGPLLGDGIFNEDGDAWKHMRELLRPQFHHKQYANLDIFKEAVDNLLAKIPADGGVIDLQPLFFQLTLDTTTAFLFGESVHSLKTPSSISAGEDAFGKYFNIAQDYVAKRFRLMDLYWLIGGKRFLDACSRVHKSADKIIDRNLSITDGSGEEDKYVFLRTLAEDTPDRTAIRGQVINILVAGRDTTACLLSWVFFQLVRYPDVMSKLRAEITVQCTENSALNRTDLRNLKYLQNVIKETLRLHPPVPVNSRTALRTTILPTGGGPDRKSPILVPKGTAMAWSVYTMHRRPDLYGMDAELFRPERWDEGMPLNLNETNSKWGYLPFNGGPRICLGMDFALTEVAYTLVRFIQKFQIIKLPLGTVVELSGVEKQTMTLVMFSTEGCKVELR